MFDFFLEVQRKGFWTYVKAVFIQLIICSINLNLQILDWCCLVSCV